MQNTSEPASQSSNFYVLVVGGIMLVGLMLLAWIGQPPRSVAVGEPLPRLDLHPLLNVEQGISNSDLENKLALLHFWGTWCPPCQKEFPEFASLAAEFAGNAELVVISVSCSAGPEYDLEKLRIQTETFMMTTSGKIPTYSDPAAMTRQQLAILLPNGSLGYPTTVLVGRDGKILEVLEGYAPGDMVKLGDVIRGKL